MVDARNIVIGLILMINRYTLIPIKVYIEIEDEHYKNGNMLLPLLGLVIGFVMFVISLLGYTYNNYFVSILIIVFYFGITKNMALTDINKVINEISESKENEEYIYNKGIISEMIAVISYFILFGLVPKTAILLTPIIGFSSKLLVESVDDKEYKKRILAFIVSFSIAFIFNYRLMVSMSLTFMIFGFFYIKINKKYNAILANKDGLIIELSQILFLIITYILKI